MRINSSAIKYFLLIFSKKYCLPTYHFGNINDIDIDSLLSKGIRAIIFDIDQTLALPDKNYIYPNYLDKYYEFQKSFKICALTNQGLNLTPEESFKRMKIFEKEYNLEVILPEKKKPNPSGFNIAQMYLGFNEEQILFIGDRVMTDIIGANLVGIKSALVEPINGDKDMLVIRLSRFVENFIIKIYMHFK